LEEGALSQEQLHNQDEDVSLGFFNIVNSPVIFVLVKLLTNDNA
jgi:hypothetical protein